MIFRMIAGLLIAYILGLLPRIVTAAALKRYNELKIANTEDSGANFGPPFFMLNYAIVRNPQTTCP